MSGRRDVNDVGILRVNHDTPDMVGIGEPHVLPGVTGVERAIDAVAPGGALPVVGFTRAGPNDAGVGGGDGDRADGGDCFVVEDGLPGDEGVAGFPNPAAGEGDVGGARVAFDYSDIIGAASHDGGTDFAELKATDGVTPGWLRKENARRQKKAAIPDDTIRGLKFRISPSVMGGRADDVAVNAPPTSPSPAAGFGKPATPSSPGSPSSTTKQSLHRRSRRRPSDPGIV